MRRVDRLEEERVQDTLKRVNHIDTVRVRAHQSLEKEKKIKNRQNSVRMREHAGKYSREIEE